MITNNVIRRLIESAILAPSGENSQPWQFNVRGNRIDVFNVPERDLSLYNWEQRASYMANGAAIENIVMAAGEAGLRAEVQFFPDRSQPEFVGSVELYPGEVRHDPLFASLGDRCTNRKRYKKEPLSDELAADLLHSTQTINGTAAYLTTDPGNIRRLGKVGSINEYLMFGNEDLHTFFFRHVSWTKEEDQRKKKGFFIDTLELSPPERMVFRLMKSWPLTSFLGNFGLVNMIRMQNTGLYSSAGGFGILTIRDDQPESFAELGRAMQRLWLTATRHGLSLQPMGGVLFFMCRLRAGSAESFTRKQAEAVRDGYQTIEKIFGVKSGEIVGFMYRTGFSEKPTARAIRFSVDEVTQFKY
jgi:nitroreductase